MFTSRPPHWFVTSLLMASSLSANANDLTEECGRLLNGPDHWDTIYVYCPSLPQMNAEQAQSLIIAVLCGTTRISGDTRIFFFRDESVLRRDRWPADQERLIESWGTAVVGAYHTRSELLTVQSIDKDEWREIFIPTARK